MVSGRQWQSWDKHSEGEIELQSLQSSCCLRKDSFSEVTMPAEAWALKNADSLPSVRKKTSSRSEFTAQKYRNHSLECSSTQAVDFKLHFHSGFRGQSMWGSSSGYQEELKTPTAGEAARGCGQGKIRILWTWTSGMDVIVLWGYREFFGFVCLFVCLFPKKANC